MSILSYFLQLVSLMWVLCAMLGIKMSEVDCPLKGSLFCQNTFSWMTQSCVCGKMEKTSAAITSQRHVCGAKVALIALGSSGFVSSLVDYSISHIWYLDLSECKPLLKAKPVCWFLDTLWDGKCVQYLAVVHYWCVVQGLHAQWNEMSSEVWHPHFTTINLIFHY